MTPPEPDAWRAGAADVWLPTAAEMADLDRRATESGATSERTLIEAAGREVAREVARRWPEGPVVGLLGSGHNGADAWVALRTLKAWGRDVRGVLCGSGPPDPDVDAGWQVPLADAAELRDVTREARVVLDGILGTGVTGAPRDPQADIIRTVNGLPVPVVAVDGPSGIDFTTGRVPGESVEARLTVALGWPNLGLLFPPARSRCGEIVAVEIGFPPWGPDQVSARAITARSVRALLPRRAPDAHKGQAGYLSLVAGREGMAGASVLAARAAGRGGAGIVRVVGAPGNRTVVQASVPDALFEPWDDPGKVREAVEWSDALAVGPGLGRGERARTLVEAVLERRDDRPALVDADGLNVWAGEPDALAARLTSDDVVTPHPGELGRLFGIPLSEVLEDPPARAREAAERLGATVLLKGTPSLIASPGRPLRVATAGGPAVASGGSGDVLSGLAGAFLAAGLRADDAAAAALLLGGLAADDSPVPEGHLASDVPDRIPAWRGRVEALLPAPPGPVIFRLPPAGPTAGASARATADG